MSKQTENSFDHFKDWHEKVYVTDNQATQMIKLP